MKKIIRITLLSLFIGAILISCSQKSENSSREEKKSAIKSEMNAESTEINKSPNKPMLSKEEASNATMEQVMTTSAAKVTGIDSLRKFIRKAELEFKVDNVLNSTHKIEDLTINFGGFVTNSSLINEINNTQTKKVSSDSSLVIVEYTVKCNITSRIPKAKLDSFLRSLAPMIQFINKRIVTAEDIQLSILESDLARLRNQNFADETQATSNKGLSSRRAALEAQADADAARIDKLRMLDKVEYSTVDIVIYQNKEVKYEMIACENYDKYEPTFGARMWTSIKKGFYIIQELLFFAMNFWGVILFGFIVYFASTRAYKRFKK